MNNEQIVEKIVEGIQERKGKNIVVVDLTKLQEAPCSYFVISIGISIKDYVREKINEKPFATDGFENAEWIAMDYGQIIVHVFQRHIRAFYDIEHLWSDAKLTKIEDVL